MSNNPILCSQMIFMCFYVYEDLYIFSWFQPKLFVRFWCVWLTSWHVVLPLIQHTMGKTTSCSWRTHSNQYCFTFTHCAINVQIAIEESLCQLILLLVCETRCFHKNKAKTYKHTHNIRWSSILQWLIKTLPCVLKFEVHVLTCGNR